MLLALGGEEVRGEEGDVAVALAQRRQRDLDAADAVVEVLAEASLLDGRFELTVRGGDDADVGGAVGGGADAAKAAVLPGAEKPRPGPRRPPARLLRERRGALGGV